MNQAILNNNINPEPDCPGRRPDIFLELLNYQATILSLLYNGFDATTSNHIWENSEVGSNNWVTIQTGGITLDNNNILLGNSVHMIRVKYIDECGYEHYTEAVIFYTAL